MTRRATLLALGLASVPATGPEAQEAGGVCVWPRPAPRCTTVLLSEMKVGAYLSGPGTNVPDFRGGLELGVLRNVSSRVGLGGTVEVGFWAYNGTWLYGVGPRLNWWLTPRTALDGSVAIRHTVESGNMDGTSVAGRAGINSGIVGLWSEVAYWTGGRFGTGVETVVGGRLGGPPGLIVSGVGGLTALIAAAIILSRI